MKFVLQLGCVLLLGVAVVFGQNRRSADDAARAAIIKLYDSLSEEQRKLARKDFDDKERYVEHFPGVQRPGLPFTKLLPEQKVLFVDVVRAMTSEYGASRCLEVAKQDGEESARQIFRRHWEFQRNLGSVGWMICASHSGVRRRNRNMKVAPITGRLAVNCSWLTGKPSARSIFT